MPRLYLLAALTLLATTAAAQPPKTPTLRVAPDNSAPYTTVQSAIDHLPTTGGTILIAPGTYREQVIVNQSHVTLKGTGSNPAAVIIVDDTSQGTRGDKPSYATVHVLGDDFHAQNLTFQNDFNRTHTQAINGSQAQALNMEGDRNILSNVRMLGNQDTLYMGARGCGQSGSRHIPPVSPPRDTGATMPVPAPPGSVIPEGTTPLPASAAAPAPTTPQPCTLTTTRSYFTHCFISGNVDYIYGDGNALFDDCEIHNTEHAQGGFLTAQGKYLADQPSVFVFNRCRITAQPGVAHVFLGRPWRPYSSVIFLNSTLGPHIDPAGWSEWHPGQTHNLDTAFYAEYKSTGPGANPAAREPKSHQLTRAEANTYASAQFLQGPDHWLPRKQPK